MRILITDDSSTLRFVIKRALEPLKAEIIELKDAFETLDFFQMGGTVDIILCDINMPGLSGIEMLRQLRERNLAGSTPFLFVTTEKSGNLIQEAKSLNAQGWITKPLDSEKLQEAIKKVLNG